jgi:6-phosphogluconate dehydrogenase
MRQRAAATTLCGGPMRFGIVGLGRIGGALGLQALEKGHQPVGYNRSPEDTKSLAKQGLEPAFSLQELVKKLDPPRLILVYVPHGKPTDQVLGDLKNLLAKGDIVMDGGNSHWKDSVRHYQELKAGGIGFLDVGTSGGIEGARHGACFMAGGDANDFAKAEPLLCSLAVPEGVVHAGPAGAGHFVKLIHNAIEFGMLQAIGEGVDLLIRSEYSLDLPALFRNWSHGSVIRGWLVELMERSLREHKLKEVSSHVEDTGEVRWAVEYALEKEAWIPVIIQSELALYRYRDPNSVAGKAVALLRHAFGDHPLHKE